MVASQRVAVALVLLVACPFAQLTKRTLKPSAAFFLCEPTGKLLPRSSICNGTKECPDMSDERYCKFKCPPGQMTCDNRNACVDEKKFCDGPEDCPDNSDEAHCKNTICPESMFECWKSSSCVPIDKICNGLKDCADGEDEDMCLDMNAEEKSHSSAASTVPLTLSKRYKNGKCGKGKFRCANGRCIPRWKRCNGQKDCQDGSDEVDCPKLLPNPEHTCRREQFHCGKTKQGGDFCIPIDWLCDGKKDCPDGKDEFHCQLKSACPAGQFRCRNDVCIAQKFVCNGIDDCGDASDEEGCPTTASSSCKRNEYKCHLGPCIPIDGVCDGLAECPHKDDERNCTLVRQCSQGEFQCPKTFICLPDGWLCDGVGDCPGNWDEQSCPENPKVKTCDADQFVCGSGQCIPRDLMCNGHQDCSDASDEHKWCGACAIDNGGCSSKCRETAHGVECLCNEEWRLASMLSGEENCQEQGACERGTHNCSHYCQPLQGGYRCNCAQGYMLERNGETCKLENQQIGRLLFSTGSQVRAISLNSKEHGADYSIVFEAPDGRVLALDHQSRAGKSYYSRESTVYSFDSKEHCLFGEFPGFVNVAVDWIVGNIYYVDETQATIGFCTQDGRFCTAFSSISLSLPRGIALHPKFGYMFVTDWSNSAHIMRIAMDGSSSMVMHTDKITWPNAVAIDYIRDRLYWVDAKHHSVESSRLDGTDRQLIVSSSILHPFDVAVFDDKVFWSDWNMKAIMMINPLNISDQRPLRSFKNQPYGIAVDHPVFQNSSWPNPCDQSSCTHLCALSPSQTSVGHLTSKCLCPGGYSLHRDGKSCYPLSAKFSTAAHWCLKTFSAHCEIGTPCLNGGTCRYEYDSQERLQRIFCECPNHHGGLYCEVASHGLGHKKWSALIAFVVCVTLIVVVYLAWRYRNRREEFYRGLRKLKSSQQILDSMAKKIRRFSQDQDSSDRVRLTEPCKGLANPVYQEKQCFIRSNPLNSYDSAATTTTTSYQA